MDEKQLKIAGYEKVTKRLWFTPDGELIDATTATLDFVEFEDLNEREQNAVLNHGFNPPEPKHKPGTPPDTSLHLGDKRRTWLQEHGGIQPTICAMIDRAMKRKS